MLREVKYELLPEHMRDGARLYIEKGIMTGSFLTAVMENNLVEAFAQADHINVDCMYDWAKFLYNEAPRGCWGSKDVVKAWKEKKGFTEL